MKVVFVQDTHNDGDPGMEDLGRALPRGELGLAGCRRARP